MLVLTPITDFHSIGAEFLSNFFGVGGTTVEHLYQASKTEDAEWKKQILAAKTPAEAKRLGRKCPVREDWNDVKLDFMRDWLLWKFSFPHLREALLATGDRELIEGNTWGDTFWGMVKQEDFRKGNGWVGENHLGKLLMEIREKLRMETV